MNNLQTLIRESAGLINTLILIVMGIALLVFFWGLVKYIVEQGSESEKIQAKGVMVWGLIALFVMVSVWGILRFIEDQFNLNSNTPRTFDFQNPTRNGSECGGGVGERPCF